MNKNDNTTLEKLFSHPLNMNIEWSEIEHMLISLGAEVETTHHSHIKVTLGKHVRTFNKPHHKNLSSKDEIVELQHFLREAGLAPNNN